MPTATTLPLIVLLIVLWRLTRGELLSIILFVSVFGEWFWSKGALAGADGKDATAQILPAGCA